MTREEALKRVEGYLTDDFPPEEFDEVEEIMSALKREPCDDCIARQPLIDKWNSCADMLMGKGDSEIVMDWIFDAPSVKPTQRWIPVSKEPPKEDGEYLCTVEDGENNRWANANCRWTYLELCDYYSATNKFDTDEYDGPVLAWMPAPKPYKAENEE